MYSWLILNVFCFSISDSGMYRQIPAVESARGGPTASMPGAGHTKEYTKLENSRLTVKG